MPNYKSADVDESAKGADEIKSGVPYWTPPAGEKGKWATTRIRVFPPRADHPDNKYYHWVAVHGNLPGRDRPVLCPNKNSDKPCAACELGNEYWSRGDEDSKKKARKFFASWRAFVNMVVLDKDSGEPVEGATIRVWGIPKGFMEDAFFPKTADLPRDSRDFTDLVKGRDLYIRRKGTGAEDTKYELSIAEPSAFPEDAYELLDNLIFLPTIYPTEEYSAIAGYLTAPKAKLPEASDPWSGDDEDEGKDANTTEGEFRELPKAGGAPWDDDADAEEDEGEKKDDTPPPSGRTGRSRQETTPDKEAAEAARARLAARLQDRSE